MCAIKDKAAQKQQHAGHPFISALVSKKQRRCIVAVASVRSKGGKYKVHVLGTHHQIQNQDEVQHVKISRIAPVVLPITTMAAAAASVAVW